MKRIRLGQSGLGVVGMQVSNTLAAIKKLTKATEKGDSFSRKGIPNFAQKDERSFGIYADALEANREIRLALKRLKPHVHRLEEVASSFRK